ncbi:unnamed protein product [Moneuplotes crassus]|uniref:GP-PDE domain-containing protein n=1 Tax=Euplotes crassus TaxID=5936 RepID=A0AAD1XKU0_EUPCR|nr:unnamed protein product [Moneuplotes crassus]
MEWYWTALLYTSSAYVSVGLILFIFPIYRLRNPIKINTSRNGMIIGTHRGGSWERVENTLPAFRHSHRLGMDLFELDVRMTKDKQVVVHHDKSLVRLTGVEADVEDTNYADLPPCMEEVRLPTFEGTYKQKPGQDDGKIPLLKDVFEEFPDSVMNIDLKNGSTEHLSEVYKMIVEYKREDITYFGNMNDKKNLQAQEMGKEAGIRSFASIKYTIRTVILYLLGLLQFFPYRYHMIWFPFFGHKFRTELYEHFGKKPMIWVAIKLYSCLTPLLKPMFWHLRKRGVTVMFYSINSEDEVIRARNYPIDGFITDAPAKIRSALDSLNGRVDTDEHLLETSNKKNE